MIQVQVRGTSETGRETMRETTAPLASIEEALAVVKETLEAFARADGTARHNGPYFPITMTVQFAFDPKIKKG